MGPPQQIPKKERKCSKLSIIHCIFPRSPTGKFPLYRAMHYGSRHGHIEGFLLGIGANCSELLIIYCNFFSTFMTNSVINFHYFGCYHYCYYITYRYVVIINIMIIVLSLILFVIVPIFHEKEPGRGGGGTKTLKDQYIFSGTVHTLLIQRV